MAWTDVRGHAAAREQLRTAFARGRLAHAYLFVGPDGVGKRRFATEFAKALLCEHPAGPLDPCDRCPACVQVAAGTHPDFLSARKGNDENVFPIDTIREFCQQVGRKASRGTRKVGLIEDADAFNDSSANAFLKVLEEPPPGSTLVLLAATLDKLLPTILSRCQVVPFRPLGPADLDAVLAAHGVADPGTRDRLARLSGGSPGRALALNDDGLWEFRESLLAGITAEKPDAIGLAEKWVKFAEEAKEGAARRDRAGLVLALFLDMLRAALRLSAADPAGLTGEPARLAALGRRVGPDRLADWLEACLAAEAQFARYVQIALVVEALFDRLSRQG